MLHARLRVLLMGALPLTPTRVMFFTGKGGVGKTSLSPTKGVTCSWRRGTRKYRLVPPDCLRSREGWLNRCLLASSPEESPV